MIRRITSCLAVCLLFVPTVYGQHKFGLKIPPGFEITEYAGSDLANDIYCMTVDPKGRIVVSSRGYIRILVDDDKDGKADRAIQFADSPKDGAMGLLWEDDTLYVTGDGGLRKFTDKNRDDRADGPSQVIRKMRTGNEHAPHAIRRGPDGWLYVVCGNYSEVDASFAQLPTSPIKDPVGGVVLRFTPDLKKSEIVAHGFRNAYGMDFNLDGELFCYDSDNERCQSLPWYEPTRFYHVIPGGHHGWLSPQRAKWWRMPPYFVDVVAPVTTLGRGSPTGVACYRHTAFPKEYHGGLFACDWTFGIVYFLKLSPKGSTYEAKKSKFIEAVGDTGFAPTAVVVHPKTGDVYVSIGGRGSRGAVYRITASRRRKPAENAGKWLPLPKRSLEWNDDTKNRIVAESRVKNLHKRRRALQTLLRYDEKLNTETKQSILFENARNADRYIRLITAKLLERNTEILFELQDRDAMVAASLALVEKRPMSFLWTNAFLTLKTRDRADKLAAMRLWQVVFGGLASKKVYTTIWEGYTLKSESEIYKYFPVSKAAERFTAMIPSGNADLDREISRVLALLKPTNIETQQKILAHFSRIKDPVDDIHYLCVLAKLGRDIPAKSVPQVAGTLLALDRKVDEAGGNRDLFWPLRIEELYRGLLKKAPSLSEAMLNHSEFGRPLHALFVLSKGFDRKRAAEVFLAKSKKPGFEWNADLIRVMSHLPGDKLQPVLRRLWGDAGLDSAILPILAKNPQPEDRDKFVSGLKSPSLVDVSIKALNRLPGKADPQEMFDLIRALGSTDAKQEKLRKTIADRLQRVTGQKDIGVDKGAWTKWLAKEHPLFAKRLLNADGVDISQWHSRLAKVDWQKGAVKRGKLVFAKAQCAACHSSSRAIGPDLRGITGRFSRDDLFTAILQPSRDVAPRYRSTFVETKAGKVYQGVVIYEASDSLILQKDATNVARLTGSQIATRRELPRSVMPVGLLDNLSDREIADLYAYMKSLR